MKQVNYFEIIHKYIPINTQSYHNYIIHVTLVSAYAIKIAKKLGLSKDQIQFIIEASMLHDIGICKVRNEISQFGKKHAKLLEEKFKKFNS